MKKIITICVLVFVSIVATAQYFELNHKAQCDNTSTIVNFLATNHQEYPIWYGIITETSKAVLFVNSNSTSWSFIVSIDDKKSCMMLSGEGFSYKPEFLSNRQKNIIDNKLNL